MSRDDRRERRRGTYGLTATTVRVEGGPVRSWSTGQILASPEGGAASRSGRPRLCGAVPSRDCGMDEVGDPRPTRLAPRSGPVLRTDRF